MNPLFTSLRWLKSLAIGDLSRRRLLSSGVKHRLPLRRTEKLALQRLEERTLLTAPYTVSGNQVTFDGSSNPNLYLQVQNGDLGYNNDGGNTFTPVTSDGTTSGTPFPVSGATVQYGQGNDTVGTLDLVGMDQGGGTFTANGPIIVSGGLTTKGADLSITGVSITVGTPALGSSGTLVANNGQVYTLTGSNTTNESVTVSGTAALTEGQTLTFQGTSGTGAFPLVSNQPYTVHVIDQSDLTNIELQLFLQTTTPTPPIMISTSSSTGMAGSLTLAATRGTSTGSFLDAPTITVGPGNQLLALGSSASENGSISVTATDTFNDVTALDFANQIAQRFNHNLQSAVAIGPGAGIQGGNVTLTATSGDLDLFASPNGGEDIANFVAKLLSENVLSLPVSVLISQATAVTEIEPGATISSSGSVTVSSAATANSTGEATDWWLNQIGAPGGFSFAFAKAVSNAQALLDANAQIRAAGDVSISSTTTTTTSATSTAQQNTKANVPANGKGVQLSGAYNNLNTTSLATVAQGAVITTTQGNVTIAAAATDNNDLTVQTALYQAGLAGLSGAGSDVNADVKASVDGTIVAAGHSTGSQETINPFLSTTFAAGNNSFSSANQIDYTTSQFVFNANPGYVTGQPLVYSSGVGGPILGLANNTPYYAIVSSSAGQYFVQLAATQADATSGTFIPFGQYPTLNGLPITNVQTGSNNEILYDFNPGFTEGQTVTFIPAPGQFLGYDNSDGSLAGPLSGTYTVHIVNSTANSTNEYAIQLLSNGETVQLDDTPYLTTATGQNIRIQSFNTDADLLTLDPSDIPAGGPSNGAALIYHQALATDVTGLTDGTTYYAIVDSSEFQNITSSSILSLQLAANLIDAEAANPAIDYPTLAWTDSSNNAQNTTIQEVQLGFPEELIGPTHSFTITSSNSTTDDLTVAEEPGATVTALTQGELLVYSGASGSSSTLQDGNTYSVNIIDQTNLNAIQLQLQDTLRLPTLGLLAEAAGAGQTFAIESVDSTDGNLLTVALDGTAAYTLLTQGESLIYAGAAIPGFLQNGQSYFVNIVSQSDSSVIQLQLTATYPINPTATLVGGGQSFTITSSNPDTNTLTLTASAGATLTDGTTLTYQGPSITTAGYLQTGQQYTAENVTANGSGSFTVQLVSASYQVGSSGFLEGSGQAATSTDSNFNPNGQSFIITSANTSTGILTIAEQAQSEYTALAEGEMLLYQGPSGAGPNTLQNGQMYAVHVISQGNLGAIQIQLHTTYQLAGYGTLTGSGGSYVIHEADANGVLWLSQVGTSQALTNGETVTFTGTSGTGSGFLQNGQTYSVIAVNQSDPNNIQIELAVYQLPTYGTLAGTGHDFTIQGFDLTTESVTLAEDAGATVSALTEGETLVYTGAALAGTELLQNGKSYTVNILDQSDPSSIQVQLLDATGPYLPDASTNGTDPLSNAIVLQPSQTLIPNGTLVTYIAGGPGTEIGGLQNGVQYQAVVDASSPTIVHLVQVGTTSGQQVQLTTNEIFEGNGNTYVLTGSDGVLHTITVAELGAASGTTDLTDGTALTYIGAFGQLTGSMVDGQTYYVSLPYAGDTTDIQLLSSPTATTPLDIQTAVNLGTLDPAYMSGAADTLTPTTNQGINITATLTSSEQLSVTSGLGHEPLVKQLKEVGSAIASKIASVFGVSGDRRFTSPDANVSSYFSVSGSFLVENITNSAIAEVGSQAVLQSSGGITVNSAVTENNQTADSATISKQSQQNPAGGSTTPLALAIGILVDNLNNTSLALIDGGSQVDASGALSVDATVTYPWAFQIDNPSGATFGSDAKTLLKSILGIGLQSEVVNNWADAAVSGNTTTVDIAGSVNDTTYTNDCEAQIYAGALINQNPAYQSATETIAVNAATTFETVNYAGNTGLDFIPADLLRAYRNDLNGGWSGVASTALGASSGATVGVGISLTLDSMNNTTIAAVGGIPSSGNQSPPGVTEVNFGAVPSSLSQTFDASTAVNTSSNTITLASGPSFTTGKLSFTTTVAARIPASTD